MLCGRSKRLQVSCHRLADLGQREQTHTPSRGQNLEITARLTRQSIC